MHSNTSSQDMVNVSKHNRVDDMIQFRCTASNGVGTPATSTVSVTVHYPALIESAPVNQVFLKKENVILHCNATGNSTPNITWSKDKSSSVLNQGDVYSFVNIPRDAAGIKRIQLGMEFVNRRKLLLLLLYIVGRGHSQQSRLIITIKKKAGLSVKLFSGVRS